MCKRKAYTPKQSFEHVFTESPKVINLKRIEILRLHVTESSSSEACLELLPQMFSFAGRMCRITLNLV